MSEDRLNSIEHVIASQEKQIQDLSDMVNTQWKEIDRINLLLAKADAKIQSLEDNTGAPEGNERPPHY